MGLFSGIIGSLGGALVKGVKKLFQKGASKVLDAGASALGNKVTEALNPKQTSLAYGDQMTAVQQQMMDFNANEAQKNRDYGQSIFDQQTKLANTEMQRKVADYQAAGLNPAALMGSGSSAGASLPSAVSGSAASAPAAVTPNLSDVFQMQKLDAEIDYMKAQTKLVSAQGEKTKEETGGLHIDNMYKEGYWQRQLDIMDQSKHEIVANTKLARQRLHTEEYETQIRSLGVDSASLDKQIKEYQSMMLKIDASVKQQVTDLQIRALELANEGKESEIVETWFQIGNILHDYLVKEGLVKYYDSMVAYYDELTKTQGVTNTVLSTPEGKQAVTNQIVGSGKKSKAEGDLSKFTIILGALGGLVKDFGVGIGAATAIKNFKANLRTPDNMNIPGGMVETPVIMN